MMQFNALKHKAILFDEAGPLLVLKHKKLCQAPA